MAWLMYNAALFKCQTSVSAGFRQGPSNIMPIYEYRCDDCDHQFEALQKMSDDALLRIALPVTKPALKKLLVGRRLSPQWQRLVRDRL